MDLFKKEDIVLHSGQKSDFWIDCNALTPGDLDTLAYLISKKYTFREVAGIPRGGLKLAKALKKHIDSTSENLLIVDDVLTTSNSMEQMKKIHLRRYFKWNIIGVVVFARGTVPRWVDALFTISPYYFLINEGQHTLFKSRMGDPVEVFINPSQREMRDVAQDGWIRFIADDNDKKFYVWDGLSGLYGTAWLKIRNLNDNRWAIDKTLLSGSAKMYKGVFTMIESSTLRSGSSEIVKAVEKKDWSWVKKYIDIRKFIEGELD